MRTLRESEGGNTHLDSWLQESSSSDNSIRKSQDVHNAIRICLFHEELNTSRFCNDQEIRKYRLELRHLEGYDAAMGGHIHLRQGGPRWAYCGSLVQQNIGESHAGHGFLLWEFDRSNPRALPSRTEVDIPNDQGFILLRLKGGLDVTPHKDKLPTRPHYYEIAYDAESKSILDSTISHYNFGFKPRDLRLLRAPPKPKTRVKDEKDEKDGKNEKEDMVEEAGARREAIVVAFNEVSKESYASGGVLMADKQKYFETVGRVARGHTNLYPSGSNRFPSTRSPSFGSSFLAYRRK